MASRLPDQDPRTDEGLLLAYGGGDGAAFEILYGRWKTRLYRFIAHQCGHEGVADELFQDVWIRVINARTDYVISARFSTWLFRIARNRLIDHWRSCGRTPVTEDFEDDVPDEMMAAHPAAAHEQPDALAERAALAARIAAAVSALPDAQREAFLLQEEGGLSLDEIATLMGTGRETVKSRLRYAMTKLRQELREWH